MDLLHKFEKLLLHLCNKSIISSCVTIIDLLHKFEKLLLHLCNKSINLFLCNSNFSNLCNKSIMEEVVVLIAINICKFI